MIEAAVYYDRGTVRRLQEQNSSLWRLARNYQSNWRVLHIDGFEGNLYLPKNCGKQITFFINPATELNALELGAAARRAGIVR